MSALIAPIARKSKTINGKPYEYAEDLLCKIRLIPYQNAWHNSIARGIRTHYETTLKTDL